MVTPIIGSLLYLINIICHFLLLFQFSMSYSSYILVQCIAGNDRVMLCCFIGGIVHRVLKALQSLQMSGTIYPMLHTMPEDWVLSTTTLKTSGPFPHFSHDAQGINSCLYLGNYCIFWNT